MFVPMLFYRDDCALDEQSDDHRTAQASPPATAPPAMEPTSVRAAPPLAVATTTGEAVAVASATAAPTTMATVAATAAGSSSVVPTLATLAREASPPGASCNHPDVTAAAAAAVPADEEEDPAAKIKGRQIWMVPHILFSSDLLFAIGSGSTSRSSSSC